jgi:hypothetical protein
MSKIRPDLVLKELKKRAATQSKEFTLEDFCFDKQLAFIQDPARFKVAVCSRRCLAEDTLVQTTNGPMPIQNIKPGDYVYSEHGKPVKVVKTFYNGIKLVHALTMNSRVLVESTLDHVFLTTNARSNTTKQLAVSEFNSGTKINRIEVNRQHGKHITTAYAIGALLGDGCSREKFKSRLYISSGTMAVPQKVAAQLDTVAIAPRSNNYTWTLPTGTGPAFYAEWAQNRYAHEKTCDIAEILSWDRESRLQFLAGLLDTDGSITNQPDGLQFRISMQAKPIIEAARILFLDLWGYLPTLKCDNRPKYKNGPVWELTLKHNYFAVKALKELDPFLVSPQKKFKPEYEHKLVNNYRPDRVGIKLGNARLARTYDIHVESPTNLYMLANGLITHNSGKTIACAADLLHTASTKKGDVAYITLNRRSAKKIIWRDLLLYNKEYKLGGKADNTELTLTMPNGSVIHVSGAKDEQEAEKLRGLALRKVYIDETQSFRPYLEGMIEDVLVPSLTDYNGSLVLIGTPGPVPAGFFYEISGGKKERSEGWSTHHWTMQDNPHIYLKSGVQPLDAIKEIAKQRGVQLEDARIQREFFGRWVQDSDSLVYKFSPNHNIYLHSAPNDAIFVVGVDIGYVDADAIAVLAYSPSERRVYCVEEYIQDKSPITPLMLKLKHFKEKYQPVKMVMDAGGLGKKIQEELLQRHGIFIEAAEKARKTEFITLLNDDLTSGRLQFLPESRFEQDSYLLQWDYSNPSRAVIDSRYHSDIADAVLYAWRECKHFYERDQVPVKPTPDQYMAELEAKEAEAMERQKAGGNAFTDVNDWSDLGIPDYDYETE